MGVGEAAKPFPTNETILAENVKLVSKMKIYTASVNEYDIYNWAVLLTDILKEAAKEAAVEIIMKFIWPAIHSKGNIVGIRINGKTISKKQDAIRKAFLEEIERIEREKGGVNQ